MKRVLGLITVFAVVALSIASLVGCQSIGVDVIGSGKLATEDFNFSGFTKVEAHNGFQVELTKSSTFSIEITADDNVHEYIEVTKSGETLKIGLEWGRSYRPVTLKAKITMPDLYRINLSGGSRASIIGFSSSHDFSVELSGGSRVTGNITAGDANFELSGGSRVNLEGTGDDLVVSGSGGSQLDLEAFSVDNADVNLSGGSRATVNVDGILNVDLSGGSRVIYVGEPTLGDIDLSGESTLSKK